MNAWHPLMHRLALLPLFLLACSPRGVTAEPAEGGGAGDCGAADVESWDAPPFDASGDIAWPTCAWWAKEDSGPPQKCGLSGECLSKWLMCVDGNCVLEGTLGARCLSCDRTEWCQPGLACAGGVCVVALASGATCPASGVGGVCPTGEACVVIHGDVGRCTRYGAAPGFPCDASGKCGGDLTCTTRSPEDTYRHCFRLLPPGSRCPLDGATLCTGDATCVSDSGPDPSIGTCRLRGTLGGECRNTGFRCVEGECFFGYPWVCAIEALDGQACDGVGRTIACRGGSTCVPDGTGFTCRRAGEGAGTRCLDGPAPCAAPLTCVAHTSAASTCEREVTGDCDPRHASNHCAAPFVCAATGWSSGRCALATREDPDAPDNRSGAPLLALPAVVEGTVGGLDYIDCFSVEIPCGASLYAEINDGAGAPIAVTLTLSDALDRTVAPSPLKPFSSSVIDGTRVGADAYGLAPGRYALCVSGSAPKYFLNVSLH